MPLILGTNSIKDTGYNVANSLRFDDGSSDYLSKSFSSAGNRQSWTWSAWIKRSKQYNGSNTNANRQVWFGGYTASNDTQWLEFGTQGDIFYYTTNSLSATGTRLMRDLSAWFHAVVVYNGSNIKFYHNNVLDCTLSLSGDRGINVGGTHTIGCMPKSAGTLRFFDGYMTEVCFIDGSQLDPDQFGEFDEDTPTIWKPKDVSGLTFGTNGFYLDFENASSLGADVSGNSNNFTVNNLTSADQTPDTCTNNFATLNPLGFAGTTPTFSQGNLNALVGSGATLYSVPTIGVSSGKWYVEGELEQASQSSGTYYVDYGFHDRPDTRGQSYYVSDGRMFWLSSWDGKINYRTGGSTTAGLVTGLGTLSVGDFFQLYLDMDNELMYWGKNGSLLNSTGVSFNGKESLTGEYFFAFGDQFTSGTHEYAVNFGQGSIDGNAVSNYQDANGFGNFKYNPTVTTDEGSKDFLALCTKNLAEFG